MPDPITDMAVDPPLPQNPDDLINQEHALTYWNGVSADVTGMLGGYPQTSRIDLQGSSNFLAKLRRGTPGVASQPLPPLARVADCGAGIGRITKGFLRNVAQTVDVVEPVKKFTDELVASLEAEAPIAGKGRIGKVVNLGLQDWVPEPGAYNLIWNQWCVGHLNDAQLVDYLRRCKEGLVETDAASLPTSWIVVKENMSTDIFHGDLYDDDDSSVTRSDRNFRKLFKEAKLKIVSTQVQPGFPKELYPVRMYALRPE